jgi:CRISPR-associated protein Cas1
VIKRTIEISRNPAHLSVRLDQLLIQPHDAPGPAGDAAPTASIPCEDLGVVIVDHDRCTYSHHALAKIAEHGGVLIVCGRDHLPAAVLLPVADHTQVVWRINDQIAISKPRRKQLWQQIVQHKVRAQAHNLPEGASERSFLLALARDVRSGDPGNVEAHAAKVYWSRWLKSSRTGAAPGASSFRRLPDGLDPLNTMLNYGYAVLRASVARAIVAAGLTPALGIHHSNRSNAFCLADDLVEPLRPIIDRRVRHLHFTAGLAELNQTAKAGLLAVLGEPAVTADESGPLMVGIQRYVASFVKSMTSDAADLDVPHIEPMGPEPGP